MSISRIASYEKQTLRMPSLVGNRLLLQHGHVVDPKNRINGVMDVLIVNGVVELVASDIQPDRDFYVLDCAG